MRPACSAALRDLKAIHLQPSASPPGGVELQAIIPVCVCVIKNKGRATMMIFWLASYIIDRDIAS